MRNYDQGATDKDKQQGIAVPSRLARLTAVPEMDSVLEDKSVQPLDHLASPSVRTFELVYWRGKTDILLSAQTVEDMEKYVRLLSSVYGDLKLEEVETRPPFLNELAGIIRPHKPQARSS